MYMSNELYHHGIKGMRWGVRRYKNEDGSLTPAGKKRYLENEAYVKKHMDELDNESTASRKTAAALRKSVSDMSKSGESVLKKAGYDSKTAKEAVRVVSAERESLAKYHDAVDSVNRNASKKLKEIDTSSMSFRKAKKEVNKILRERDREEMQAYVNYEYSKEHEEYLRSK